MTEKALKFLLQYTAEKFVYIRYQPKKSGKIHISLLSESSTIFRTLSKKCLSYRAVTDSNFGYSSMALTKNLPYQGIINYVLNEFIEDGQFQRSYQKWSTMTLPTCPGPSFNDLGFHKVVFLFSIICFGIALALVIFIYEKGSYKPNSSNDSGSAVTLNINIKLNPEELQRLINIVEDIDGQNHELLIRELRSKYSNPP